MRIQALVGVDLVLCDSSLVHRNGEVGRSDELSNVCCYFGSLLHDLHSFALALPVRVAENSTWTPVLPVAMAKLINTLSRVQ